MSTTTCYTCIDSPVGHICLEGDGHFLTGLYLPKHKGWRGPDRSWQQTDKPFVAVREQLNGYFAGDRHAFDIPLRLAGTPFQREVWEQLMRIPFGKTLSYGELAIRVGRPNAFRAVGSANGCNPISIIVPCHRVIGSDGQLTGYGGGLGNKRWLLDWERDTKGNNAVSSANRRRAVTSAV